MRSSMTTEDKMDYIIEYMLSDYANYNKLLTSHNVSIFRKILYLCFKIDRHDFVGRKAIHEEILSLGNMLDADEWIGESNTLEIVEWMADEVNEAIEACGCETRMIKSMGRKNRLKQDNIKGEIRYL